MKATKNQRNHAFKTLARWFKWLFNIVTFAFAALTIAMFTLSRLNPTGQARILGFEVRTVISESMTGSIDRGTTIISVRADTDKLQIGDIITFATDYYGDEKIITHRIVSIDTAEEGRVFATRGDHNPDGDPFQVLEKDVISRYAVSLPGSTFFNNRLLPFLKTPAGIASGLALAAAFAALIVIINRLGRELHSGGRTQEESDDIDFTDPKFAKLKAELDRELGHEERKGD